MVIQYPDTATILGKAPNSVLEGGIWQTGTIPDAITQKGRYEPSTLNREQQLADGTTQKLKGIFFMPVGAPEVDTGSKFQVTNRLGDVVLTTNVLFFERGQLNCKVYL
ncbi:MAG: hypothetical protein ABI067_07010 [Leifsonia sp.]